MVNDIPFESLLAPGGAARSLLASSWGQWADVFCDQLLLKLVETHVEDLVLQFGAKIANVGEHEGKTVINVRWGEDRGWTQYRGDTYELAIQNLWKAVHYGNGIKKGNTDVNSNDEGRAQEEGSLYGAD